MATQTIARPVGGPAGSIRQRREANRPSIGRQTTRAGTADAADTSKKDIPVPYIRTADYILKKYGDEPPSLVVHLHPTHFRFDQQDGNFSYTSPMRIFLSHLKQKTVPHEMLDELLQSEVPFYEGCLIVHVHDHKTGATPSQSTSSTMSGGSKASPFSMHNWNEHVTPSPYVSYPTRNDAKSQAQAVKKEGASEGRDSDKENMPAPNQPASSQPKQKREVPVMKTVLFPTSQSMNEEAGILLRTPYDEGRDKKKHTNASVPSTPLTAVPPTPIGSKVPPAKRQKMCLDSTNIHEWEAEVINRTAPPLFLEPAKDTHHMLQIMDFMKDPTQPKAAAAPQKRKRTTAELAADEAQAAEEERFMLIQDERVQPSSATAAAGSGGTGADGQAGGSKFEPTFSSFKTLENIKMRHEEMEQQKKEEADRQTMLRNQQKEAEQQRRKEEAERNAQQVRAAQQRVHQEDLQRQQQQAAAAAQHAQNQAAMMAQRNAHIQNTQAHHFQVTSGAAMSPVVRNQTPGLMNSSPVMNGGPIMSQSMTSVPMSATPSNHGVSAGSPPRPASAISHHPNGVQMGRQVSQQTHTGSAHGTPQLNQSTPMMQQPMPATSRNMTPQPRVNQQGSPIGGMNQPTPVMMNTPQMPPQMMANMQNLTPQQRMQYMQRMQAMNNQQGSPQSMTPEQMQQIMQLQQQQRAQAHMQQNPMAANMNGGNAATNMMNQDYQARLQRQQQQQQQQQQMLMQQQNGGGQPMASSSPGGNPAMAAAMRNGQMGGGRQPSIPNLPGIPQQLIEKCKQEWQQRMTVEIQRARHSGNEATVGQIQQKYRAQFQPFVQARYKQLQQPQMQHRAAAAAAAGGAGGAMPQQGGQPGMPQMNGMQQNGGMPNGGGMQAGGGGGAGGGMSQEMYMQQLQQQQQRMMAASQAQRQQAQAQAQAQAQMQMQQMGQGGQGMGGGGFPQGMNMAQMAQMAQMRGMGRGMQ